LRRTAESAQSSRTGSTATTHRCTPTSAINERKAVSSNSRPLSRGDTS
jgi:hypothetical protein